MIRYAQGERCVDELLAVVRADGTREDGHEEQGRDEVPRGGAVGSRDARTRQVVVRHCPVVAALRARVAGAMHVSPQEWRKPLLLLSAGPTCSLDPTHSSV